MIDVTQPYSPGWWLRRLQEKLVTQARHHAWLQTYMDGTNAVPIAADKAVRESYRRLMAVSRTNFAELAVEATRERMQPVGFRTGASGDAQSDSEAQRIWQVNHLDADFAHVLRTSQVGGVGYMSTDAPDPATNVARVTVESPLSVVTEQHPIQHRRSVAALKLLRDTTRGVDRAYVWLAADVLQGSDRGGLFVAERDASQDAHNTDPTLVVGAYDWVAAQPLPQAFTHWVPVVKFTNNPDANGRGWGEYERHLSVLDRITYTVLQRVEIATMQAFRQRGLVGNMPQVDPKTGDPIDYNDIFSSDPGSLWAIPEGVEVWESAQIDWSAIGRAIRDDVQDFAAGTRTPMFYLSPDAADGSAEGASLAREGLVFKVKDRIAQAGESLELVMAQAFAWQQDEVRSKAHDMEVIWASPEHLTISERANAAVAYQAAGVTWEETMRSVLGFTPAQIERMAAERASQQFLTASFADAGQ